jgi:RHS repeat-associated protein
LDITGLYYYGARYYDPTIGRFVSADTVVPSASNPQTLNRYSYCLNNPLRYIDPSGNIVEIPLPFDFYALLQMGMVPGPSVLSGYADLCSAYAMLSEVAPEITQTLEQSDIVFQIRAIDQQQIGLTKYTRENTGEPVQITIDPHKVKSVKSMAWALSHEFIHATIIDQVWEAGMPGTNSSKYEEAIAFQFQHSVGNRIGFDPGPHNPWSFMWRSSEQSANEILRKSLWVDLSAPPETLRDKLNRAFRDTSYRNTRALPPAEYFGVMNSIINTFIR